MNSVVSSSCTPMIDLQNVSVQVAGGSPLARTLLRDVSVQISAGEWVAVVGGNGAGKSTLLKVLAGMMPWASGNILIDGRSLAHLTHRQRAQWIATVLQDPKSGTIAGMSVGENMAFAWQRGQRRWLWWFRTAARQAACQALLNAAPNDLYARWHQDVVSLSGGQRQTLSLLMANVRPCKVLLLDEITAALDPASSMCVMQMVQKLVRQSGVTCVMVTHNMADALTYADRVLVMRQGQCVRTWAGHDKQSLSAADLADALLV